VFRQHLLETLRVQVIFVLIAWLTSLDLGSTKVTNAGLKHLEPLQKLASLNLFDNR
jgi:hypothetical protein